MPVILFETYCRLPFCNSSILEHPSSYGLTIFKKMEHLFCVWKVKDHFLEKDGVIRIPKLFSLIVQQSNVCILSVMTGRAFTTFWHLVHSILLPCYNAKKIGQPNISAEECLQNVIYDCICLYYYLTHISEIPTAMQLCWKNPTSYGSIASLKHEAPIFRKKMEPYELANS